MCISDRTDDFIQKAGDLTRIARHLGHALLVVVQFLQRRHRQIDVVLLEAIQAGRIVQHDVGIEYEQLGRLLAGFARHQGDSPGKGLQGTDEIQNFRA
jgi:hypothetical protein